MITCTTFIFQFVCVKIPDWTFIICAISLRFMKNIEKGHQLGMRKLMYYAISSLNLFPRNSLKRLPFSAFQSVSKYFDNMQFQPQTMFTLYPIVKEKADLVHCGQGRVLSVALQVLHLLKMEQSSPALEEKLFQKQHPQCEQKPIPINFL